jgi:hypothetical protein
MSKILQKKKIKGLFSELLAAPQKTGCASAN